MRWNRSPFTFVVSVIKNDRTRCHVAREPCNLLTAIKQGIISVSTKSELVKLEQEREQLRQTMQNQKTKADTVAEFLPDTLGRFKAGAG